MNSNVCFWNMMNNNVDNIVDLTLTPTLGQETVGDSCKCIITCTGIYLISIIKFNKKVIWYINMD